jgi:hypothetical protein
MYLPADEHRVRPADDAAIEPPVTEGEAVDIAATLLSSVSRAYATEERSRRERRTELMIARATTPEV